MNRAGAILTKHSFLLASILICIVFAFVFVWLFICICMTSFLYPLWAGGTLSTPDQTFLSISFDPWPSFPIPSSLSSRFNSEVSKISICQILQRWQISLLFFFMFFFILVKYLLFCSLEFFFKNHVSENIWSVEKKKNWEGRVRTDGKKTEFPIVDWTPSVEGVK